MSALLIIGIVWGVLAIVAGVMLFHSSRHAPVWEEPDVDDYLYGPRSQARRDRVGGWDG